MCFWSLSLTAPTSVTTAAIAFIFPTAYLVHVWEGGKILNKTFSYQKMRFVSKFAMGTVDFGRIFL